jgi:5-methylcytosine-specific restriction endonuclease McrA
VAWKKAGASPGGVNGPRGDAMVPELLKRLAGRSASTSAAEKTKTGEVQGLERRVPSEPVGNPLPSAWVRMYVWRRDHGRCVRCGGHERVWFEYVVPVRAGGSNTEQNIRLMCERCSHDRRASARRKRLRS